MRGMVIEGVRHFHGVHVAKFSLPGYDSAAQFNKEAPTTTEDAPATLAVTIAILQHFCRVFKTAVLLWTPWLDRPILCCRPALPGLKQAPPSQGYHVAILGVPGALRFISLRPRPPMGSKPTPASSTSAAATQVMPRHWARAVKLPGVALTPVSVGFAAAKHQSAAAGDRGAVRQQVAFVVDAISLMDYSTSLCSQTRGFLRKPHPFYLKLKALAKLGVVRPGGEHRGLLGVLFSPIWFGCGWLDMRLTRNCFAATDLLIHVPSAADELACAGSRLLGPSPFTAEASARYPPWCVVPIRN